MKIADFGYDGEGVGHIDGKVCFVPYTIVGEEVEIKKIKETSSFIKARAEKVVKASPIRQNPPCPYFSICGGCDFQHIGYNDELELKEKLLARQLEKIGYHGKIEVLSSRNEYGYRNKIKLFPCSNGLGLKIAGSDKVKHIEKCLLIDDKMNFALNALNQFVKNNHLQESLENVYIRKFGDACAVWFDYKKAQKIDYTGLSLVLGDFDIYTSVKGENFQKYGKLEMEERVNGLTVSYNIKAFKQVNDEVCKVLYEDILKLIDGERVLNGYSGAGVLSVLLAKNAKKVVGVELGAEEHESAEKLKELNNIENLTNIQGDCAEVFGSLNEEFDSIVIDPPRSGLNSKVCEAINLMKVGQVIYVSCNRASLIRDLQRLDKFKLKCVKIYDMFPRTANFEVLALLEPLK